MEIKDLKVTAALLTLPNVKLESSRREHNTIYFTLSGRTEEEFEQLKHDFFKRNFLVDACTFGQQWEVLKDVITSHGLKLGYQLQGGEIWQKPK